MSSNRQALWNIQIIGPSTLDKTNLKLKEIPTHQKPYHAGQMVKALYRPVMPQIILMNTGIFISNPKNLCPYFGLKTFELLDDPSIFN
jgi:hypothetical protein